MNDQVRIGELRVALNREGAGEPLLLMHGAEASRHMFSALNPHLTQHFTVIAYDQRDCGDTEGPESPSTLEDLAEDAYDLVKVLGFKRVHVFGSSFGGRVAQALALMYPQSVDHLVLGSTWPLPRPYDELCPEGRAISQLRRGLPATAQELATWFFPESYLEAQPHLRDIFAQVRPQTARSERRATTVATSLGRGVADIVAPTLVLAGELDRVVPASVTLAMTDRIRGASGVLLPGVGHATAIQAPETVASHLVRFLKSRTSK